MYTVTVQIYIIVFARVAQNTIVVFLVLLVIQCNSYCRLNAITTFFAKLSQKFKLKLQILAEMVKIS